MPPSVAVRRATVADTDVIARQRVAMWVDMGVADPGIVPELHRACADALAPILRSGEYVGWLAATIDAPESIVAGAGVHFRPVLPLPVRRADGSVFVDPGRHPTVVNVYTEPAFRRRGLARQLMTRVLDWAEAEGIGMLHLHATPAGRGLYESLGFGPTGDMRLKLTERRRD